MTTNTLTTDGNVTITMDNGNSITLRNHGDMTFNRDGSVGLDAWTSAVEEMISKYFSSDLVTKQLEVYKLENINITIQSEPTIEPNKPEYVNIMLMEEMHKIDKNKLWASIRAFGDGGIG